MSPSQKAERLFLTVLAAAAATLVILGIRVLWLLTDNESLKDKTYENGFLYGAFLAVLITISASSLSIHITTRRKPSDSPQPPRPVDPANPPHYATVVHADGDSVTVCTCHGRVLQEGDTVLYWPQPAHLLCAETHQQPSEGA